MSNFKTKRVGAGFYEVTNGVLTVIVMSGDFWSGPGWIAAANWDPNLVTDPVPTKRIAVECAHHMLENAEALA